MSPRVVAVVGAIAIAIGCGCAGSQLPPQHACAMPIAVSARPPVPSRRVPLRFVATEGGGRLPVANVWIGRDRAPLVIDTGANGHVLTEGLRWYLGLPSIDDPNRGRVTIVTDENNSPHTLAIVTGGEGKLTDGGGGFPFILSDLKSLLESGKSLQD